MPDHPLVSAVVTTHNRKERLKRALDSVKAQTYRNIELVVVDDGSKESVQDVVLEYEQIVGRVIFHRNETAKGACSARNKGIELASGEFIAGLDDDDEWMPGRIQKLMESYEDNYAFVTSDVLHIYPNRELVWKKDAVITLERLLYSNQVGNQGLIKRERLVEIGGFGESLSSAQDYDLWVRLCERYGPVRNVQQPLQKIHLEHDGEQITTPKNQLKGYLQFYSKYKHMMNRDQQRYQLYTIRKATGKATKLSDLIKWVPSKYFWKEFKVFLLKKFG
jgi:glycosyltransferase involved in cell wall biosynthesis